MTKLVKRPAHGTPRSACGNGEGSTFLTPLWRANGETRQVFGARSLGSNPGAKRKEG